MFHIFTKNELQRNKISSYDFVEFIYSFFLNRSENNFYIFLLYFLRGFNSRFIPFSGINITICFFNSTGILVFSFGSKENFNNKLYKIAFTSMRANLEPMQLRGPSPNGMYVPGMMRSLFSSAKRSGSNFEGSGKYCGSC